MTFVKRSRRELFAPGNFYIAQRCISSPILGTGWNIFEDTEQIAKEVDSLWSDASAGSWLARAQHYVTFTLLAKKWFVKCLHLTAERAEV